MAKVREAELLASVFELHADPIFIVDQRSRTIRDFNAAAERLFGWPRAELIGKPTLVLFADEAAWRAIPERHFRHMSADKVVEIRLMGRDRLGREFPIRVRGSAVVHKGVTYNTLHLFDLSEIEAANAQLKRQTVELRERMKELNCVFRVTEILARTELSFEKRLEKLLPVVIAGWQYPDHTHVRLVLASTQYASPGFIEGVARQTAEIEVKGVSIGVLTVSYDVDFPAADEGPFLKEERQLLEDIALRIGVAVDRAGIVRDMQQAEARLRFLSDRLPVRIAVSDWDTGDILYMNALAREEFDDHAIGKSQPNIADLYYDVADRKRLRALLERDGSVAGFVLSTRFRGEPRWTSVYAELMEFEGRRAIYAVRIDITEQRNAEEAMRRSQRLEAIGQLAGGIAHDFNNLLTALAMNLDLLKSEPSIGDAARKAVAMANTAIQRGANLTRHLLSFARKQELTPNRIEVAQLIAEQSPFIERTLGGHIKVNVQAHGSDLWLFADRGLFESALLNLAINARDAMPVGGTVTISIVATNIVEGAPETVEVTPGKYIEIAVADTGTGMSPEVIERAFEPFFTTKEIGRGTGLGLSMVHGFVRQSGGFTRIESEPGKGTTVRLFFPRDTSAVQESVDAAPSQTAAGEEHVMLVDDDDLVRESMAAQLRALGYRVSEAESGAHALRLLGAAQPDVLVTDSMMPGMLGGELVGKVRPLFPALPILVISGNLDTAERKSMEAFPPIDFFEKPFAPSDLGVRIRALLAASAAPRRTPG
ncbi:MAG: ATP-binding protein [Alphaproteobacteria bacterium]